MFSKCLLVYYDSNKVSTKSSYLPYDSYTFTTDNDTKYISMRIGYGNSVSGTTYKLNVIINEGNTALPYEPYGNGTWYLKQQIGKVVLDGSESNWAKQDTWSSVGNVTNAFYIDRNRVNMDNYAQNTAIVSNYFQYVSNLTTVDTYGMLVVSNVIIRVPKAIDTVSDLQTWLSTHNTEVYYIMTTPIYTPITGTLAEQLENVYQKMLSQKGQTNISQVNDDLAFGLSVQALEDLS